MSKAKIWRIILLLSLVSCWIIKCSNPFSSLRKQDIELTAEDYVEAELVALCLSGELIAPDDLSSQVLGDLAEIRSIYIEKYSSFSRIRFEPPWIPSCLIISFDSATAQQVANDEYHSWDQLNESYEVINIDTSSIRNDWVVLNFRDRLHPRRLAEIYGTLPGVIYAEPDFWGGDSSRVYPRQTYRGITYLFYEGWGDCPAGCINKIYWYFGIGYNRPAFIGYWNPQEDPREPDWWRAAKQNIEVFLKF